MNSFISPAARGEQPPLSLPCVPGREKVPGGPCACPVEVPAAFPWPRGPPEHRQSLLCVRVCGGSDDSQRPERGPGRGDAANKFAPPKGAGGDGDGDCDSAGHKQPAGAAARVSLGRAPRGAPACSGISFQGES